MSRTHLAYASHHLQPKVVTGIWAYIEKKLMPIILGVSETLWDSWNQG